MEFSAFRLNKIKILKNRDWREGKVKFLSFVTGVIGSLPGRDDLHRTSDVEKKDLIKAAAQSVLSAKALMHIENVKDGHQMTFGDTGYALYAAEKIPL